MAAALDVNAVVSHCVAANKLSASGRFVRAAEQWGRAAEAARAFGAPDCLVVANAQARRSRHLAPLALIAPLADTLIDADSVASCAQTFQASWLVCASELEPPDRALAVLNSALTTLLPDAMDVLERRRLAGTLLYGKCAPHEVEFARQLARTVDSSNVEREVACAPLLGYQVFMKAARLALHRLWIMDCDTVPPVAMTADQKVLSFVLKALDLMCAPRPFDGGCYDEAMLLDGVSRALSDAALSIHHEALRAAYGRVRAVGTASRRGIEDALQVVRADFKGARAKSQEDNDARGLQSCAHCGATEVHVKHFKHCAACKAVVFCCKDCQLANWPAHKAACKAARKAAAGAAAGA